MQRKIFILILALFCIKAPAQNEPAGKILDSYKEELRALGKQPKIDTCFESILSSESQTQADLILLNEIEAPPFKEAKRGKAFFELMKKIGVDSVWIDKVGNVIGLRKGTSRKRTVALDAHLDTVFPEGTDVKVNHRGDTLFAPGIGDDTRGLAMVLSVLRSMNEANLQTKADVLFIGTVGEEGLGDLRGVKGTSIN